jgi:hypothetical protein
LAALGYFSLSSDIRAEFLALGRLVRRRGDIPVPSGINDGKKNTGQKQQAWVTVPKPS